MDRRTDSQSKRTEGCRPSFFGSKTRIDRPQWPTRSAAFSPPPQLSSFRPYRDIPTETPEPVPPPAMPKNWLAFSDWTLNETILFDCGHTGCAGGHVMYKHAGGHDFYPMGVYRSDGKERYCESCDALQIMEDPDARPIASATFSHQAASAVRHLQEDARYRYRQADDGHGPK